MMLNDIRATFTAAGLSYDLGEIAVGETELAITAAVNEAAAKITQVTLDTIAISPIATGAEFSVDISGIAASGLATGTIVISVTAGDDSTTTDYTLTFKRKRPFAPDVNRDGEIDITDGFLIVRYLLGFRGDDLIAGIKDTADAAEIEARMQAEVNAQTPTLDVNGDGQTTAADGILIMRHLLGVTEGEGLTAGQIDTGNPPNPGVPDNIFVSFNTQATL